MKEKIKIEGLDCPSCGEELKETLLKEDNVKSCEVSFMHQTIIIDYDGSRDNIDKIITSFDGGSICLIEDSQNFEKVIIKIKNLDCPACGEELNDEILKIDGIKDSKVDFLSQTIVLTGNKTGIEKAKETISNFEDVEIIEDKKKQVKSIYKQIMTFLGNNKVLAIILGVTFMIIGVILNYKLEKNLIFLSYIAFILSFLIAGFEVILKTISNVSKGHIFDENFLMTIAAIGAIAIGYYEEAAFVMIFYQLGEYFQSRAVEASRKDIKSLMELKVDIAHVINGETIIDTDPKEVEVGQTILVKNGEKVPLDGVIVEGESSFDTKSLTGEGLYRDLKINDNVMASYINKGSIVKVKVEKAYEDSSLSKILSLIEDNQEKKSKPEKFITKFSKYYTPIVCSLALILGLIVPLIVSLVQGGNYVQNYQDYLYRAMSLLVISCPCALIISVPLTYFNSLGVASKYGILIKGATVLDSLEQCKTYAFDKTGTLTKGEFEIINTNLDDEQLKLIASLEKNSSHPLAKTFNKYQGNYEFNDVEEISGKGIKGIYQGDSYLVGNEKLMETIPSFNKKESISTVLYFAKNNEYLGYVEIDDSLKAEARDALEELRKMKIENIIMLSGDNVARAKVIAEYLKLDDYKGNLLPEDKLFEAEKLMEHNHVLYVGDGINDAAVMSTCTVSASMGKLGSDAAREASDIVLVSDNLYSLVIEKRIAHKNREIVLENIIGSIVIKVILMILGVIGILPLGVAVLGDVGVMLLAVCNSLRMRLIKNKYNY